MTDKEQIKCKYKFQDKEKFDGKPYCTCFCELCEDLPPCDDNCQIYEDFKQLARKTQECEQKDKEVNGLNIIIDRLLEAGGYDKDISRAEDFENVYSDIDYKVGLLEELKQECEELKKQLETVEKWRIKAEGLNENFELKNTCYRKALDEIENLVKPIEDGLSYHHWEEQIHERCQKVLYIINKTKGEE